MSDIDKHAILEADDLPVMEVPTPEWEPKTPCVYVRKMSVAEVIAAGDLSGTPEKDRVFLQKFCVMVTCDAQGKRVFADEDHEKLAHKQALVLKRICEAAQEHNGMVETDEDDEEDAVKNLPETTDGSSTSNLPTTLDTDTPT